MKSPLIAAVAAFMIGFTSLSCVAEEAPGQDGPKAAAEAPAAAKPQTPPPLTLDVALEKPLVKGEKANVRLIVKDKDGKGVGLDGLDETLQKKMEVWLIDESLSDHVHTTLMPGKEAGEWNFTFTPETAHNYKLWFGLMLTGKDAGRAAATLQGAASCAESCVDKTPSAKAVDGDIAARLVFDKPRLHPGSGYKASLYLTGPDGKPLENIEPVADKYARIAAFMERPRGGISFYPLGIDAKLDRDKDASPVRFMVAPKDEGFMRIFVSVKTKGKEYAFPFGLDVKSKATSPQPR